jgi:peptidoglycan hydrolase-like protein with peptidoglycan-binding domain
LYGAKISAHAQIDTTDPATGIKYSLIYLHLSSVTKTKDVSDNQTIVYNQGDVIGHIGNNGEVHPVPTPAQPQLGSHLHLGLGVKKPGELNYLMVDPQTLFDANDPYVGNYQFTRDLFMGSWGDDVIRLQQRLGITPTWGGFGPKTFAAVKAYQAINNLPQTGYAGKLTRATLNA